MAIAGTALILALATSGAAPSHTLAAQNGAPVRVPPPQHGAAPPDPGAAAASVAPHGPPSASAADAASSRAVLRSDATFADLLHGVGYRVVSISPWTDATGAGQLGTVVDVQLDAPLTATTELPGVRFDADGTTYRELSIPVKVTGATTMTLLVDLHSRRVVSAMPPDATLAPTPATHGLFAAPGDRHGS
ncbi:MAG: hypothetical protein ACTHOE_01225 [Conexibacter sp.]